MILLRSAAYNVFFFVTTFALSLYGVSLRLFAPGRIPGLTRAWGRLEVSGARAICGIRYTVSGWENVPPGPCLIASQHQSAFDTIIWFQLLPRCTYVIKRELARLPLFGPLTRRAGAIVVDRARGASALRGLVRDGKRAAAEGRQVVIFPEGTRAAPGRGLPVQPGIAALAAGTGLPVIPVLTDSGAFWGRRAFRKRPGVIRIVILPPLPIDLPRGELQQRLALLYRSGVPVDNSVDSPSVGLADDRSRMQEQIDQP